MPLDASLESTQFAGIRYSVRLGRLLQEILPEIALEFRSGQSLLEIAISHELQKRFRISKPTAIEGVRLALVGYQSTFRFVEDAPYDGLIPEDEYATLAKEHHSQNARKIDGQMKEKGRGIYAIPLEQRVSNGKKGAKAQPHNRLYEQTPEEHRKHGRLGAEASGYTVWSDEERLSALNMATLPGDVYRRGSRIACGRIAHELNIQYHGGNQIRTPRAVIKFMNAYNNGLRK